MAQALKRKASEEGLLPQVCTNERMITFLRLEGKGCRRAAAMQLLHIRLDVALLVSSCIAHEPM